MSRGKGSGVSRKGYGSQLRQMPPPAGWEFNSGDAAGRRIIGLSNARARFTAKHPAKSRKHRGNR